ncbi:MAG: hypothetical protein L3K26_13835 [Candidatus Hydrogenedentes bacterium]|nr:hypothetical protein [Candidatus Hydrogenedentota bacterium]
MIRGLSIIIFALSVLVFPYDAVAHQKLSEGVQQQVSLEAGTTYIDLTLRLTFFDHQAEHQQLLLDSNGDGRFSSAERTAFGKALLKMAEKQVSLHAEGRKLALLPRYDPEIRADPAESGHFEIRLHFFARRSTKIDEGALLEVRSGLFPHIPALTAFRVSGRNGVRISTAGSTHKLTRPANASQPLVLAARLYR